MIKKLIDDHGFNRLVQAKHGYIVYNKNDTYIGKSIEKYGEYSEEEFAIFDQLCQAGDIVVEVGANIGTHTLAIAKKIGKTGRIYVFEPQRMVFQTLCANMAINSIDNAECYQAGASSENGHVLIPDLPADAPENFGGIAIDKFDEGHKVPLVKLDDFLTLNRLKLLKIDVEGMESQAIMGASNLINTFKPAIYIENDRRENSKELIELIWSLDYDAYWHLPSLYNPNNFADVKEDLFPGIISVNMLCFHKNSGVELQNFHKVSDSNEHPFMNR